MAMNVLSPSKYVTPSAVKDEARLMMIAAGQTDNPYTPGHWSQNLIVRTIIGMLVTAGVTLVLVRVVDLIMMWFLPIDGFWKTLAGFVVWQSLQMVGTFFGGMMTAAGRYQMTTLGLMLGVVIGFTTIIVFPTNPVVPSALYFIMPSWFMVAGAIGAWLGDKLWHPQYRKIPRIISSSKLSQEQHDTSVAALIRQAVLGMIFAQIHWLRIILALMLILPVLWYAQSMVNWGILNLNLASWAKEVGLQKSWVATMIKIVVVVFAAAMTGAGTTHGIAHGFWTGVICGVFDLLLHVFFPPADGLIVNDILWEVGWVFLLSIIAGGFGALIVPPIMFLARRRQPVTLR